MKLAARTGYGPDYRGMVADMDEELFQDWWQAYLEDPEILDGPRMRL